MTNKPKSVIRREMLQKRASLDLALKESFDISIQNSVLSSRHFYECDAILCYASYQSEIDTFQIMKKALLSDKLVFCPRVNGDKMEFYQITDLNDLIEGYKGIPEPDNKHILSVTKLLSSDKHPEHLLMLVPLSAFNKEKYRIGYGKGFYDKYLSHFSYPLTTIGLAYDFQLTDELIPDAYDIPLNMVLTPTTIYE